MNSFRFILKKDMFIQLVAYKGNFLLIFPLVVHLLKRQKHSGLKHIKYLFREG